MTRFPISAALTIAMLGIGLTLLPRVAPAIKGPDVSAITGLDRKSVV